ncbi:MAG: ABC transporter permease [Acidobacteriota bacterium]
MRTREAFALALENLAAHTLRSALTMLGVVFGVGAVIAMLSIGAGAERQALEAISRLGLHNVVVRAKTLSEAEAREVRETSLGVSMRDVEAIEDAVPGVELALPKVEIDPDLVLSRTGSADALVWGVAARHADVVAIELAEGRFLDALDERDHAQVAVIGDAVRRELFGSGQALGRDVKVDDVWLEVIGVLASSDAGDGGGEAFQGVALGSNASVIYVTVSTALRKFDRDPLASPLAEIIVRLDRAESGRRVAAVIDELLVRLHGGADDYELVVPEALLAESRRTQRMFNLVMGAIASISLLVGGIGIMNIMLASVLERTREIGVRRAVGARRRDVLVQFVVESFTLSALGGVAGVMLGVAIAEGVAASAGWPTAVEAWAVLLSVGVAVGVGLVSGIYPAVRASRLDPVESLRYE